MILAIRSIVLLVCVAVCTAITIKHCRCLKTVKTVKPSLIAQVKEFSPHPHCKEQQVIVILKDNRELCLDPKHEFTKAVLRTVKMQTERNSANNQQSQQQPQHQ